MNRIRGKITYANVISTLCLVLLLGGGTAYAASQLDKGSVGTQQLKNEAVTPAKLSKQAKANLEGPKGPAGATGATGPQGAKGDQGPRGPEGERGPTGVATAYAYVLPGGAVEPERSVGVTSADVTHAATGAYCIHDLAFTIRSAVANPVDVVAPLGARVLPEPFPKASANPCGLGQTRVEIFNTSTNAAVDANFIVWLEK
jgi:hypothetical protein